MAAAAESMNISRQCAHKWWRRFQDEGAAGLRDRSSRAATRNRPGLGYTHIHTAIDAYSRLAYSEFAGPENTDNCVAFLTRAVAWFATQGITIQRVLTDNGVGSGLRAQSMPASEASTPAGPALSPPLRDEAGLMPAFSPAAVVAALPRALR